MKSNICRARQAPLTAARGHITVSRNDARGLSKYPCIQTLFEGGPGRGAYTPERRPWFPSGLLPTGGAQDGMKGKALPQDLSHSVAPWCQFEHRRMCYAAGKRQARESGDVLDGQLGHHALAIAAHSFHAKLEHAGDVFTALSF